MSETALALVQSITAVEFFKPGASKSIIDNVKKEARELAATFDVSTPAGAEGIRSLAAKLGKVKNKIETEGKALVSGEKARLKIIDTERGVIWDEMEALQKEVRQPLTDLEEAEKKRVATHEFNILELTESGNYVAQNWQMLSVDDMRARLKAITESQYDWQEFIGRARTVCAASIGQIKDAIGRRETMDAEAAELVRLRAESVKREQEEREARIAQEARDAAEAIARHREEEQRAAAEAERVRIEAERVESEARAKQAEALRVAAEEKAKRDAEEAEERLLAEQQRAREAHAQRVEAEERSAHEAELATQKAEEQERYHQESLKHEQERAERERLAAIEAERERAADAAKVAADREKRAQTEAAQTRYNEAHGRILREEAAITALDAKLLSAGVLKARKATAANKTKAVRLEGEIAAMVAELSSIKTALENLEKLSQTPQCPTCKQAITPDILDAVIGPIAKSYWELDQKRVDAIAERKALGDPDGAAKEVAVHEQASADMEAAKGRVQEDRRIMKDAEAKLEAVTGSSQVASTPAPSLFPQSLVLVALLAWAASGLCGCAKRYPNHIAFSPSGETYWMETKPTTLHGICARMYKGSIPSPYMWVIEHPHGINAQTHMSLATEVSIYRTEQDATAYAESVCPTKASTK